MQNIIGLVDSLIGLAYNLGASDIHIDPQAGNVRVRLRIDGQLQDQEPFLKDIHQELISRIKILAGLRTDQHQVAQDGRFCADGVDIRVSVVPTYYGENAVMRLLKDNNQQFSLDSLGFSSQDKEKILHALQKSSGMILATGPTGSGKTTTLYTLLKLLKTPNVSIITIEDPIEYSLEGISQIGVNSKTGLTFANGLRSILRQDPNIIMVGEIRDQETASLAINAALTGHLVLATLHTSDAAGSLPRLIDLGIEPYLIASTVSLIISQRLARKMSGTGYKGRIGVNEVLVVDEAIRNTIYQKASASQIKEAAKNQKMIGMREDGFLKVKEGITTIEEILRIFHE